MRLETSLSAGKTEALKKSDTQQFWIDLCSNVLGMEDQTTALHFESRTTGAGWIDVVVPDSKTFMDLTPVW